MVGSAVARVDAQQRFIMAAIPPRCSSGLQTNPAGPAVVLYSASAEFICVHHYFFGNRKSKNGRAKCISILFKWNGSMDILFKCCTE